MKNQTKLKASIFAMLFLGLSSMNAICQEESKDSKSIQLIEKLDKNKDNVLDKEEVKSDKDLTANFAKIDSDKDGKIDKKELDSYFLKH